MYKIHDDFAIVEEAKKWCLEDGYGTNSASVLAKVILSKYNSKEFPCVLDLQQLVGVLDTKRLQLAIGVMLYSNDSLGTWSEMADLKELYLDCEYREPSAISKI